MSSTLGDTDSKAAKYFDDNLEKKSKLCIAYEKDSLEKKIHLSKNGIEYFCFLALKSNIYSVLFFEEASDFSVNCAKTLMKIYKSDSNPFKTKQTLENYKLRVIKFQF